MIACLNSVEKVATQLYSAYMHTGAYSTVCCKMSQRAPPPFCGRARNSISAPRGPWKHDQAHAVPLLSHESFVLSLYVLCSK